MPPFFVPPTRSASCTYRMCVVAYVKASVFSFAFLTFSLVLFHAFWCSPSLKPSFAIERRCEDNIVDIGPSMKAWSSFFRFADALSAPLTPASSSPPPPFATFGFTKAALLSGGLGDCLPNPNASTCIGGLATATAVFRNVTRALRSEHAEFIFNFDKDTAFVLMHPLDYAINIVTMREFGIRYYYAEPSLIPSRAGRKALNLFFNDDVQILQANLNIPRTDDWYGFVNRQAMLFGNVIGVIVVDSSVQPPYSLSATDAILTATKFLRTRVKVIVVVSNDASTAGARLLFDLSRNPPDVFLDLLANPPDASRAEGTCRTAFHGSTHFCSVASGPVTVNLLHLYLNATRNGLSSAVVETISLTSIRYDDPALDSKYYSDQLFLAKEASKAISFDPVVGTTSVGMPSGGWWDNTYPCFAGECPQSVVYGKALMRCVPEADFAIVNTGGFRGKGWPRGSIHLSHIWEMYPYTNTIVGLRVTGFKVWELMEMSARMFLGDNCFDGDAGRNLQGFGFQIEIDMTRPRYTNRLLSVKIRSRATGELEPLDRMRFYTIATDSFLYSGMPGISTILQRQYRGENVSFPFGTILVQTAMAEMFSANSPYDSLYANTLVLLNTTTSASARRPPMEWRQTEESCGQREFWDEGIVSCVLCPTGTARNYSVRGVSSSSCVVHLSRNSGVPTNTILIAATVVGGIGFALACGGTFAFFEVRRRRNTRNTGMAPQSGVGISFVFSDIQSSTKLWGAVPASMAVALELHHRVIRECIARYHGYEVKTIGDSFMIACDNVENSVMIAVGIQESLSEQQWPSAIAKLYACEGAIDEQMQLSLLHDLPMELLRGPDCGLLVRVGISTGIAEALFDEVSKGYDYHGPAVNLASKIEATAQGGQVLASNNTTSRLLVTSNMAVEGEDAATYTVSHFANAELENIAGFTELVQITPKSLSHRKFDPKRMGRKGLAVTALQMLAEACIDKESKSGSEERIIDHNSATEEASIHAREKRHIVSDGLPFRVPSEETTREVKTLSPASSFLWDGSSTGGGGVGDVSPLSTGGLGVRPTLQQCSLLCQEALASLMLITSPSATNTILELLCAAWRIPSSQTATPTPTTYTNAHAPTAVGVKRIVESDSTSLIGATTKVHGFPQGEEETIAQLSLSASPALKRRLERNKLTRIAKEILFRVPTATPATSGLPETADDVGEHP